MNMNNGTMAMANTSATSNMGKFFTSNYLITLLLILVIVIILVYLFVRLGYSVKNYQSDSPYIIEETIQGTNAMYFPGSKLLRSYDQPLGLEFSYSFWIYLDENTFNNSGKWHHVFHKGNSSANPLQAPGVWIYPNENKMMINMNTYNKIKNSCDISNIPMNKWVCISMVVTENKLDVYVNANLKKRFDLGGIVKQNYGDIYACKWGGFSGFLSRLRYYAYALPFYSIEKIYNQGPSEAPCVSTGAKPPNLSPEYWMTTGFPNTQVNV